MLGSGSEAADVKSAEYLAQKDARAYLDNLVGRQAWVTLYQRLNSDNSSQTGTIYSAVLPNELVERALENDDWDLRIGDCRPGYSISYDGDKKVVAYQHFSNRLEPYPLLLRRNFHGVRPNYWDVLEEFRLFHNLYEDKSRGTYLKVTDAGEEEDVVRVSDNNATARLGEVRQFLAAKKAHLAVFIDLVRYSPANIGVLAESDRHVDVRTNDRAYHFSARGDGFLREGYQSVSRLVGKRLIPPLPEEECGLWPYDEHKDPDVSFIIGVDEKGAAFEHSCDPEGLSNYFGANPGAPHYLTPVFFRREVLRRYYDNPGRYSVVDGYVQCAGLWGMRVDNDHHEYVIAYLGDLGRDLPYTERLYWRSNNIQPDGKLSRTAFKRGVMAEFTDPQRPDLLLPYRYKQLNDACEKSLGWPLWKPLRPDDAHALTSLHVPLGKSQAEFDEQVLLLAKLLVDSLNETAIVKATANPSSEPNVKGITKFDIFLAERGLVARAEVTQVLRDIQDLRSSGSAHRKGEAFSRIASKVGLTSDSAQEVFAKLLERALAALEQLKSHFVAGVEASE